MYNFSLKEHVIYTCTTHRCIHQIASVSYATTTLLTSFIDMSDERKRRRSESSEKSAVVHKKAAPPPPPGLTSSQVNYLYLYFIFHFDMI